MVRELAFNPQVRPPVSGGSNWEERSANLDVQHPSLFTQRWR